MKIEHNTQRDTVKVMLSNEIITQAFEIADGVVSRDAQGNVVEVVVANASRKVSVWMLEPTSERELANTVLQYAQKASECQM
jgi:hypothetical protein